MGLGISHDEAFDRVRDLCKLHEKKYNFYINRKRLKSMMEIIFLRKDVDAG